MRALLWFKQDLRLDDHPALQAALSANCLLPLYVLDPALLQFDEFGSRRIGVHRARFLLAVSYTHLRAHETPEHLVCRLLLEKKK